MKKITSVLAISGALALGLSSTANAANNGVLKFSGTLTNISCSVAPGAGTGPGPRLVTLPLTWATYRSLKLVPLVKTSWRLRPLSSCWSTARRVPINTTW